MRSLFHGRTLEQSFSISTALLVLVLIGTTMVIVEKRVESNMRHGLEDRGTAIAESIAAVSTPSLLAYNYAALQLAAEGAAGNQGVVYVTIRDKEGALAGVAGRTSSDLKAQDADVSAASATRDVEVARAKGHPEQVVEVSVPVHVEGVDVAWGRVSVGLSYDIVATELRRLGIQLFLLGALLAIVAVLCVRWLARRITAPLRNLVAGTEALSAGELQHRIPVSGTKELVELARAFNTMSDRLEGKAEESATLQTALEALNATLEHQVIERTRLLEESTAQYKSLVESSPDSILIVQDGRVRFVNRSFADTFGVPETEAMRPDFQLSRLFDPSSAALAGGRIAAWERGEAPAPAEVLAQDAQGRTRHLELRGSRIEYQGRPAAECLLVDMTEAKRLRERLSETEKLRALGELASGVAHDFNNLLGAILGRAQLLRRSGEVKAADHDLAVIEKAAQDGRETVRRIQEFSRTRRDKKFEPVDVAEILKDCLEITKTRWSDDALRRKVNIKPSLDALTVPPILGNASELREVFTNLILNAVDAMPQGGRLELSCAAAGDRVVARVTDTGVGMTENIRQHLFDPFFTTKGTRGMGLGMSVVYGIVTRHEGKIDVATALGKGTTFTLEFPVSHERPIHVAGGDGASLPQLIRPGKILVVDDEPEVAAVVRDVLESAGHAVDTAISGVDALQMLDVSPYDLVFTDLGMPDMSGWEVAEKINEVKPGTPVALVTGWGTALDEGDARKKGVTAVVHKPFEIDELLRIAHSLLAQRLAVPNSN
ncbi:MAG TPA: ATP-binding protein [Candidatus Polarisedimenticolaceae bacterium]|nr:ATP-binding protein [Candidatus Polarisedimenticolaceae bacterium]